MCSILRQHYFLLMYVNSQYYFWRSWWFPHEHIYNISSIWREIPVSKFKKYQTERRKSENYSAIFSIKPEDVFSRINECVLSKRWRLRRSWSENCSSEFHLTWSKKQKKCYFNFCHCLLEFIRPSEFPVWQLKTKQSAQPKKNHKWITQIIKWTKNTKDYCAVLCCARLMFQHVK